MSVNISLACVVSRLQIEFLGRLDALVTENAPNKFVFAGPVLEDQSTRRMAELMHGNAQPGRLLNSLDDLGAERDLFLVVAGLAGEQPIRVAAAHQRRAGSRGRIR